VLKYHQSTTVSSLDHFAMTIAHYWALGCASGPAIHRKQ